MYSSASATSKAIPADHRLGKLSVKNQLPDRGSLDEEGSRIGRARCVDTRVEHSDHSVMCQLGEQAELLACAYEFGFRSGQEYLHRHITGE